MLVTTNAKVWAASTCVLYAKFLAVVYVQGMLTFEAGGRPPEDAKKFKDVKQNYGLAPPVDKDKKLIKAKAVEHRWRRIVANDIESIPLGLLVFGTGVLTEANETVHLGAMVAFTAMRCLHSYAYANEKQPHPARAWMLTTAAVLVGVDNAVFSAVVTH